MASFFDGLLFTYQSLIFSIGINGLLALSMYVVLAVGQLSVGQAAFMGLGAYASSLLAKAGVPMPLSLVAAMFVPAFAALVVGGPTLRLSGVYLALATIGLGEVERIALINLPFTGGALGLSGIPLIPEYTALCVIFGTLALLLLAFVFVCRSGIGRAMEAIREDEVAAGVMGINLPKAKLAALVVSAMIAGLAGAFNAHVTSFIGPNDYGFDTAVTILSFAILGGIGSPFGPVLGAIVLTLLPEVLRPIHDYRTVVNGLIIVIAVTYMPRGILPWRIGRTAASPGRESAI